MEDKKLLLTYEDAIGLLEDKEHIHTFRSAALGLIGADWKRGTLLDAIKNGEPQIGGSSCKSIGHGLVIFNNGLPLFIETRKNAVEEFEAAIKIKGVIPGAAGNSSATPTQQSYGARR